MTSSNYSNNRPKQASNISSSYNPSGVKKTEIKNNIADSDDDDRNKNKKSKTKKDESDEEEQPKPKKPQTKVNNPPLKPITASKPANNSNDDDFKEVIEEIAPNFKSNVNISNDPFSFFSESKPVQNNVSNHDINDIFSNETKHSSLGQTNKTKDMSGPDLFFLGVSSNTQPPNPNTGNVSSLGGKLPK